MESLTHSLASLFDQLGLDSSEDDIKRFIDKNGSLPEGIPLHKADFWNESQANFLEQAVDTDAAWVEIVNQLDVMLR